MKNTQPLMNMKKKHTMMLPRYKSYVRGGKISVPEELTVGFGDEYGEHAKAALSYILDGRELRITDTADAFIVFRRCLTEERGEEYYELECSEKQILLKYCDQRGAVNAAMTLAGLLQTDSLFTGLLCDRPDNRYRSFMLDLARGIKPLESVKTVIALAAVAKYNRCHLHLMDSAGLCYSSAALPEIKGRYDMQYSMEDMREIARLCQLFSIEIIPETEIPAHSGAFLKAYPELECRTDDDQPFESKWALCPAADGVWSKYKALVGEIVELFPCTYFHIGGDELEFPSRPELNQLCNWDSCRRCKALRAREGLSGKREEYYYVINRMYEIVTSFGKKVIMWNDQINIAGNPPIPDDVLIQYWRIAAPTNGPIEGCSAGKFAEKGFSLINSDYRRTYLDFDQYMNPENLRDWTVQSLDGLTPETEASVTGGECCAWEFGNQAEYPFYDYTLPSDLFMFSDRLWNRSEVDYDEDYASALSCSIFGFKTENNVFEIIGSLIPPRKKDKFTYLAKDEINPADIDKCIKELSGQRSRLYSRVCGSYIYLLEQIKAYSENSN